MSDLEQLALDAQTFNNARQEREERKEEITNPDPKCPRCGRSIKGKLIHLITPDQILHTFLCANEKCHTVISLQVDFMTMHANMMREMGVGQPGGMNPVAGRTPGGIIMPGN